MLDRLLVRQEELMVLTKINSNLQMDEFLYTEGKISQRSSGFSKKVKVAYVAEAGAYCWCLLTDAVLPKQTVVGAHLFKHKWKDRSHVIGIEDIDDTRNGLPVWKPVEWAFDTSR